jgi:Flp pilus assembly protein TadD
MPIRTSRVLIVAAVCLTLPCGCTSSLKLSDLGTPQAAGVANGAADAGDTTGSITAQTAEPGRKDELGDLLARVGLLGDNPNEDVQLGKKYLRSNNFELAEQAFRAATQRHPRDAEAWIGLAVSCDRLLRFEAADRAYAEAIRIVGPTADILNDQGFSYMLRGEYTHAQKKLREAEAKEPANPYVQANIRLLEDSYHESKALQ